jgi:hypothetical protein
VDILPSTRKRISSGWAANGRTATAFLGLFDLDFLNNDLALLVRLFLFCKCARAGLRGFGLRFRGGIRRSLLRRPGIAACVTEVFYHTAITTAQNVPHEFDCPVGEEICAMNVTHSRLEET